MPVTPNQPDLPGSDPSPYPGFRDTVRTLIRDGMPSYATSPYGLVRQEQLTDEIPATSTPTQTTFYVRFDSVPLGRNITVQAVPGTIAAYRDGSTTPDTIANGKVTQDIDANGNFTLQTAPQSSLLVTYGWQILADGDIDQLLDEARSWLVEFATLDVVPDGLNPALTQYAAGLACQSIARMARLPDVTIGDAKEALSAVAKGYEQDAKDHFARAATHRKAYWSSADRPLQPAAGVLSVTYPVYQPRR